MPSGPRPIATMPVRETSTKPSGIISATKLSILSLAPVIFDCVVDPNENCFPMIPSGRAHNEMLLGDATVSVEDAITEEGKVMV